MWTYNQLFNVLKTWFMSRWWDILCSDDMLWQYINLAIQDLYNEDNSTWRHKIEKLEWTLVNGYYKYTTQFRIQKVQHCYPMMSDWNYNFWENADILPSIFGITNEKELTFSWNKIVTHKNINKIYVVYLEEFSPISSANKSDIIPIPFRLVPALLKMAFDWAAPINLMQWEVATTDFYSHGITRSNKVRENDSLTDYQDLIPAYTNNR